MVITIGESTRQAVKLLDSFHQSWLDILEFFFSKTRRRATYLCIKKKGSSNSRSAPWPWMGLDILELKWRCPSRTRRDNLSALLLLCLCNWREGANVTDTFLVGIKIETPAGSFMLCTLHTARQVAWSNCWYSSNTAFSIYHLLFLSISQHLLLQVGFLSLHYYDPFLKNIFQQKRKRQNWDAIKERKRNAKL